MFIDMEPRHVGDCLEIPAHSIKIISPKRKRTDQTGWEGFFPYYAGFPENFANSILGSAGLDDAAVVLDPWNGSGTTTYTAARRGHSVLGLDINPVMIAVARARMLAKSEADSLCPLANEIVRSSKSYAIRRSGDQLSAWFSESTTSTIRSIERSLRQKLVGSLTLTGQGPKLEHLSSLASAYYVALFAVCRDLTMRFRSSNPTWLRIPKQGERKISASREAIEARFCGHIDRMATALVNREGNSGSGPASVKVQLADTTKPHLRRHSIDFILTSPPYCTRIDYAAATRIELAVMQPLVENTALELSARMIGSTRVPQVSITPKPNWGATCARFLQQVAAHPSKASKGYYLSTHLDYFDKLSRSMDCLERALKPGGQAVFVVQDSFYKEVHNDLAKIVTEMAEQRNWKCTGHVAFSAGRSMASINTKSRQYLDKSSAVESVLCFFKPR